MKAIQSIPNADRTFTALRSLGYSLNSSLADIIDNSISAKSKKIEIQLKKKKDKFFLTLKDDGKGMTEKQLEEAMRIGTEAQYDDGDLGKFGMGMKTASLSHCNVLTVISKTKSSNIAAFQWNLDHIKDKNEWELLRLSEKELFEKLNTIVGYKIKGSGTIIIWEDMMIMDNEYNSYSSIKLAENYLYRLVEEIKLYIATIFHRFLDGSLGSKRHIKILFNEKPLRAWDPFCRNETNTIVFDLKKELSQFYIDGYSKPIKINGYVLPHQDMFSTEKAWKEAKGTLSWNDAQGYYIYREGRLIRFGGWQGTKAKDEHDKLARISIDINSQMDELFRLNVNKNRVQFPELLFNHLKNTINPKVIKKAQEQYRKKEKNIIYKNKFRNQQKKLAEISIGFVKEQNIKTLYKDHGDDRDVVVKNKAGGFLSNRLNEFLKFGNNQSFEVISSELNDNHLWKLISDADEKFKLIINSKHPFYKKIYESNNHKSITNSIDALLMSLAFAELYNKSEQNVQLFEMFKTICSQVLENLVKEEII